MSVEIESEARSELVEKLAQKLCHAEELRIGLVTKTHHSKIKDSAHAIGLAIEVYIEAGIARAIPQDKQERTRLILAQAGGALMAATIFESVIKHGVDNVYAKKFLLGQALMWTRSLEKLSDQLDTLNETVHGSPIIWKAEIARLHGRYHERQPRNRQLHLLQATKLYQSVAEIAERKKAETSGNRDLFAFATGVEGVAIGEAARVYDCLIHEFGTKEVSEQQVGALYKQSVILVWQLFGTKAENADRIDAVFSRYLIYCHDHDINPPEELFINWIELNSKYPKLITPRMAKRVQDGLIPPQYVGFFK